VSSEKSGMCRQKIASFVFLAGIVLLAFDSHVSAENPSGFKGVCTVNDSCTSVGQCSDYDLDSLVTPAPSDTTTTPISCTCCETPITSAPDTVAATLTVATTPIPVLLQCWGKADITMSTTGKTASSLWPIGATTTTCGAAQANFRNHSKTNCLRSMFNVDHSVSCSLAHSRI